MKLVKFEDNIIIWDVGQKNIYYLGWFLDLFLF